MKQIFIGGTGRSGTTILSKWLGSFSSISNFPHEARFHVDDGGVISLFRALVQDYSVDQARMAYARFRRMMTKDLTNRYTSPYQGIDLRDVIGGNYDYALRELEKKIIIGEFEGRDYHTKRNLPRAFHQPISRVENLVSHAENLVERFTGNRTLSISQFFRPVEHMYAVKKLEIHEAEEIFGSFIENIFNSWADKEGVSGWCEDTPANALHLSFLAQVLPNSRHLCIVRNPYGTLFSWLNQIWAPNDFEVCVSLLASIYKTIIDQINALPEAERSRLKVIRLEDLYSEDIQCAIKEFVGLAMECPDNSVRIKKIDFQYDRRNLSPDMIACVDEKLGFVNDYFGY